MIAIAVSLTILALVLTVIGILATTGKLPGNSVIGLHVPEVRKSQENWVVAHKIAGPLWTLSGVVLLLGSLVAYRAVGWMWAIPAFAFVAAIVLLGIGAAIAAKSIVIIDAQAEESGDDEGGCCGGGGCGGDDNAEKPEVNLDALRKAASKTDNTGN